MTTSESYTITFTGLDAAVNAAVATSTGRPAEGAEQSFVVITDGKRTERNGSDSKEAMHVIRLIVKVCKLNT